MKVCVLLFAGAREAAGVEQVEIELADGATFGELRTRMVDQLPELAGLAAASRFASDAAYVSDEAVVDRAAEVALIPPVSGG